MTVVMPVQMCLCLKPQCPKCSRHSTGEGHSFWAELGWWAGGVPATDWVQQAGESRCSLDFQLLCPYKSRGELHSSHHHLLSGLGARVLPKNLILFLFLCPRIIQITEFKASRSANLANVVGLINSGLRIDGLKECWNSSLLWLVLPLQLKWESI